MRAPEYWKKGSQSVLPTVLTPFSMLYALIDGINRKMTNTRSVDVPVVCIGNIVAGGAGKTPVAIEIARFLIHSGWSVHFLSRGYGGKEKGPLRVSLDVHRAEDVGDEPLILASVAPTWIASDRYAGATKAVEAGADIILMDDGFQNRSLKKDLSLLVIDAGYGIGNGRLLPAGPLRETVVSALQRTDGVIVVGEKPDFSFLDGVSVPVFSARIVPHALQKELVGEKVVAFAGIGRPQKFFDSLIDAGAEVIEALEFPDHYSFKRDDIMKLVEKAALHNAALVTTRKDYVRLTDEARMMTTVFDIDLMFEQPDRLQQLLKGIMGSREHA
ncbi:tetraacyldisaccharide 4'-kinase [Sneathiella sp.]|uniref:tetraacyldisaccharide 4'-kinase n=1 Tax=Sneathiella sp. TaxID=1964365 RepID=UPI0039E5FCA3